MVDLLRLDPRLRTGKVDLVTVQLNERPALGIRLLFELNVFAMTDEMLLEDKVVGRNS